MDSFKLAFGHKWFHVLISGLLLCLVYCVAFAIVRSIWPPIQSGHINQHGVLAVSLTFGILTSCGVSVYTRHAPYIKTIFQFLIYVVAFATVGLGLFVVIAWL